MWPVPRPTLRGSFYEIQNPYETFKVVNVRTNLTLASSVGALHVLTVWWRVSSMFSLPKSRRLGTCGRHKPRVRKLHNIMKLGFCLVCSSSTEGRGKRTARSSHQPGLYSKAGLKEERRTRKGRRGRERDKERDREEGRERQTSK